MSTRIALVTGAAGIAGKAVSAHFEALGDTVVGIDVVDLPGGRRCDLTDPDDARRVVDAIAAEHGRVDVLANVAGGFAMGEAVHELSDDTWNVMMNVNARTMLNATRAVVPHMLAAGRGRIVSVAARPGQRGLALLGAYCASKSVVIRLTESLADELKEKGINVNCILPSVIDTPRNRQDMPDADFGRWVRPEEIADVIGFLASDAARAIHGAAIPVEGLS